MKEANFSFQNAAADVCKIMVGNKSDAKMEEREITEARGKEVSMKIYHLTWFKTLLIQR